MRTDFTLEVSIAFPTLWDGLDVSNVGNKKTNVFIRDLINLNFINTNQIIKMKNYHLAVGESLDYFLDAVLIVGS